MYIERMLGRALRIALLVFEAVWLNAVVPGHTRGIVRLPGTDCQACESAAQHDGCCMDEQGGKPAAPRHKSGDPAAHCAICHFAARVTAPPFVDFTPPPMARVGSVPRFGSPVICSPTPLTPYDGRAPPAQA